MSRAVSVCLIPVLFGALLASGPAHADVKSVRITVRVTCVYCGKLSRSRLEKLPGVERTTVSVLPPYMEVRIRKGAWPDLTKMQAIIRDIGEFPDPGGLILVVSGKVLGDGNRLLLNVDGVQPARTVELHVKEGSPAAKFLREHPAAPVEVTGHLHYAEASTGVPAAEVLEVTSARAETGH